VKGIANAIENGKEIANVIVKESEIVKEIVIVKETEIELMRIMNLNDVAENEQKKTRMTTAQGIVCYALVYVHFKLT